jgi:hypothetical protein
VDIVVLPDVALKKRWMIRHAIEDLRRRETEAGQLGSEITIRYGRHDGHSPSTDAEYSGKASGCVCRERYANTCIGSWVHIAVGSRALQGVATRPCDAEPGMIVASPLLARSPDHVFDGRRQVLTPTKPAPAVLLARARDPLEVLGNCSPGIGRPLSCRQKLWIEHVF